MITHAALDAQMKLTPLTHCNEYPRLYKHFLFLSGDMPRYCHKRNHFLHDLITRVFLQSLQYGIVVTGFSLMLLVYAHHKHRHDSENP